MALNQHGFTYDVHSDEAAADFFATMERAGVDEARIAAMKTTRENFLAGETVGKLPNGCDRETAERKLALYFQRMRGGYKNQQIAAREDVRRATGMGVRDLRKWLGENPAESTRYARLRSNAEAADVCAKMRRDEAEAAGAVNAGDDPGAVAHYELKVAIAKAAREQADLARAKLITYVQESRDPEYLAFLETYNYAAYLADGKIGPLAAWRAKVAA